jgi:hypothetical protein
MLLVSVSPCWLWSRVGAGVQRLKMDASEDVERVDKE